MNRASLLLVVVAICVAVIVGINWFSSPESSVELQPDIGEPLPSASSSSYLPEDEEPSSTNTSANFAALGLQLVGISYSAIKANSSALIAYLDETHLTSVGDNVGQSKATVESIAQDHVFIAFEGIRYRLNISTRDSASAANSDDIENPTSDELSMTADEIGMRPRILEHIVSLPSERYLGTPPTITPGLNPKLFQAAGFKEGDELVSVNGYDVSDPDLFEDIQTMIKSAHTLKFEVYRNGRKIVLFLDIPSESMRIE